MAAFPRFREHHYSIIADTPVGQHEDSPDYLGGAYLVAESIVNDDLRRFIVDACNAVTDKAEAAEPAPLGWYVGIHLQSLEAGPLASLEAATAWGRKEYGPHRSFFVVHAEQAHGNFRPFSMHADSVGRIVTRIERLNERFGFPGVLPPLRPHHEADLAEMLNDAVEAWSRKHGIKLITARIGAAREIRVVGPARISIRQESAPVSVDDDFAAWAAGFATPTPTGPHTGCMNAMLDDIGGAAC